MSYYFSKTLDLPFDEAIAHVTEELKKEGFGVLTEIDVSGTLKKKIDVDFRPYTILIRENCIAEDLVRTCFPYIEPVDRVLCPQWVPCCISFTHHISSMYQEKVVL